VTPLKKKKKSRNSETDWGLNLLGSGEGEIVNRTGRSGSGAGSLSSSVASLKMSPGEDDTGSHRPLFYKTVNQILQDHLKAARKYVTDPDILEELEDDLESDCDALKSFLMATQVSILVAIRLL
jgi:aspartate kinase